MDRLFLSSYWAASLRVALALASVSLLPSLSFGQTPETVVDISQDVAAQQEAARQAAITGERQAKIPKRLIRNVTYRVDRIVPTHKNKAGKMMGEADFAIDLRYTDTKDVMIKAYSDTGEVVILADVTREPNLIKLDDGEWRWRADCISNDPGYSHPKHTCHVGRWPKEKDDDHSDHDTAVAAGRYWIKLYVLDKEATGITIKVTYETVLDDIDVNLELNGELYDPTSSQVAAGEVNTVEFDYRLPNGELVDFTMYHGAMMHFVILKPDLSRLSHVHPMYDMKKKKFTLMLNKARPGDPNNKDLATALPDPGTYYVLTETQPTIKDRPVQAWFSRYQLHAPGTPPEYKPLTIEVPDSYPYYDKYFTADNKEGREGDFLRVRFTKIYELSCFRWGLQFQLFFSVWDGEKYVPLSTNHIGKWLMMPGHAIYVRENLDERTRNSDWSFRYIAHAHAASKPAMDGSGLLNYPVHVHGGSIPAGNYKIWFQTRLFGKVSTFPFTFEVVIPDEGSNLPRNDVVKSFCAAPAFDNL